MNRTQRQKEQSRINGNKSRGPKSEEGKLRSSRNAYKHGLTSSSFNSMKYLSRDDRKMKEELERQFYNLFPARTLYKLTLREQLVESKFRLMKAEAYEAEACRRFEVEGEQVFRDKIKASERERGELESQMDELRASSHIWEGLAGGVPMPKGLTVVHWEEFRKILEQKVDVAKRESLKKITDAASLINFLQSECGFTPMAIRDEVLSLYRAEEEKLKLSLSRITAAIRNGRKELRLRRRLHGLLPLRDLECVLRIRKHEEKKFNWALKEYRKR